MDAATLTIEQPREGWTRHTLQTHTEYGWHGADRPAEMHTDTLVRTYAVTLSDQFGDGTLLRAQTFYGPGAYSEFQRDRVTRAQGSEWLRIIGKMAARCDAMTIVRDDTAAAA